MRHVKIPDTWTGPEALAFVALLDRLTDAIWRAYGPQMALCLSRQHWRRLRQRSGRPPVTLYDNMRHFDAWTDNRPEEATS